MHCWGELKCLRAQSLGEVSVSVVLHAIKRIINKLWSGCGNEILTHSQPGLQQVEKLVIPLSSASRIRSTFDVSKTACSSSVYFMSDHAPMLYKV